MEPSDPILAGFSWLRFLLGANLTRFFTIWASQSPWAEAVAAWAPKSKNPSGKSKGLAKCLEKGMD